MYRKILLLLTSMILINAKPANQLDFRFYFCIILHSKNGEFFKQIFEKDVDMRQLKERLEVKEIT